jgi:hypothetical protein
MNKKKRIALVLGILMMGLFIQQAYAQDEIGANAVTGQVYICFFFTPLDIFNGQVTFGENGGLTISSFGGYGFYLPLANAFTSAYWALNATVGQERGDLIMLMAGTSFDPFVAGTGAIILEYSAVYPLVFSGFKAELQ